MGVEHNKNKIWSLFFTWTSFLRSLHVKMTKFQISSNQVKIILKLFRNVYLVGVGHTFNALGSLLFTWTSFCILLRVKMTKFQISSNQVNILLKLFKNVYLVGAGHTWACDLILLFHTHTTQFYLTIWPNKLLWGRGNYIYRFCLEQFVINIMECGALGKMDIIISDASAVLRNLPWPGTGGLA